MTRFCLLLPAIFAQDQADLLNDHLLLEDHEGQHDRVLNSKANHTCMSRKKNRAILDDNYRPIDEFKFTKNLNLQQNEQVYVECFATDKCRVMCLEKRGKPKIYVQRVPAGHMLVDAPENHKCMNSKQNHASLKGNRITIDEFKFTYNLNLQENEQVNVECFGIYKCLVKCVEKRGKPKIYVKRVPEYHTCMNFKKNRAIMDGRPRSIDIFMFTKYLNLTQNQQERVDCLQNEKCLVECREYQGKPKIFVQREKDLKDKCAKKVRGLNQPGQTGLPAMELCKDGYRLSTSDNAIAKTDIVTCEPNTGIYIAINRNNAVVCYSSDRICVKDDRR